MCIKFLGEKDLGDTVEMTFDVSDDVFEKILKYGKELYPDIEDKETLVSRVLKKWLVEAANDPEKLAHIIKKGGNHA